MIYLDCEECVEGMQKSIEDYGRTYTTKSVSGQSEEKECRELLGYSCSLTGWEDRGHVEEKLGERNYNFLKVEFDEWVSRKVGNPGKACEEDTETWQPFLTEDGKFTYTYNHRFFLKDQVTSAETQPRSQFDNAMDCLIEDPFSRQAYIGIWNPYTDSARTLQSGPEGRVPCTIGYHFLIRPWGDDDYHLEMIYSMRSLCASWNLWNDLWLVTTLFDWFREELTKRGLKVNGKELSTEGTIHINTGSLHSFK